MVRLGLLVYSSGFTKKVTKMLEEKKNTKRKDSAAYSMDNTILVK